LGILLGGQSIAKAIKVHRFDAFERHFERFAIDPFPIDAEGAPLLHEESLNATLHEQMPARHDVRDRSRLLVVELDAGQLAELAAVPGEAAAMSPLADLRSQLDGLRSSMGAFQAVDVSPENAVQGAQQSLALFETSLERFRGSIAPAAPPEPAQAPSGGRPPGVSFDRNGEPPRLALNRLFSV
jgi:hypothetical protein